MSLVARFSTLVAAFLLLSIAWPLAPAGADGGEGSPPAEAEEGPGEGGGDTPSVAEDAPPPAAGAVQLHKIYVPFRDLGKIFEKEDEGVFLPYEEFLSLWKRAHVPVRDPQTPPVSAVVRAATYEGAVEGDVVTLRAKLELEVLTDGWHRVPLVFAGAGIEEARLAGRPALLLPSSGGYSLLVDGAGRKELELVLRVPTSGDGENRQATFSVPPVPLSRLTLDVPGGATEVDVHPRTAATTEPLEGSTTRLVAFLGAVEQVRISWRQRVEEEKRVEPLVFADEQHDVRIDPGVLRSELSVAFSILRAPVRSLTLDVPPDAVTLYLQGDGLKSWERSDDGTTIRIELREPVRERWGLRLGLERPLPPLPSRVTLPMAFVRDVERETGFVRILAGAGVKIEPAETPGLLQVDVAELPQPLQGTPPGRTFAYRYPARPGLVTLNVEALEPRVSVEQGTRVTIRAEGTDVAVVADYAVERAGIFGVAFALPDDLDVLAVRVKGVAYNDHKVREDDGRRVLDVSFGDRLLGGARVEIDARRTTPLPGEGEDTAREVTFDLPLVEVLRANHVRGYLAIHLDPALEHREASREGLTPLDAAAPAALEPPANPGGPAPLVHRFEHHEGALALDVALRRRDPQVRATVETALRVEPDRTRIATTMRYDIRYRGVGTLRFTAPLAVKDRMHVDLEGIQLLGPEPIQDDDDRGLWTIRLPTERMGAVPITLEIEDAPEESLPVSASRRVTLPTFVPLGAKGEALPSTVHNLAVKRDPLLEVATEELDHAEEIDARELPPTLKSEDNFLAYRAYDPDWGGAVVVTRHDYEPVAEVVISHMHLDTVVHEGRATTEAYLVVRNNERQVLKLALPEAATIRAVTVAGKSRAPYKGEEGVIGIPLLSGLAKDASFVVAVAYDHDVALDDGLVFQSMTAQSPRPIDVESDLLTWRLFMPDGRTYTSFGGTLEPSRPYASWFAGLINRLFHTVHRDFPGHAVDLNALTRGFVSPFASRREGTVFLFRNRMGVGSVTIGSADTGAFAFVKLIVFGLVFLGGLFLARFAERIGLGAGTFLMAVVLVILTLLVRAGPGAAAMLNAALYAALLAGLLLWLRRAVHARRVRRAAAAAAAEDEPTPIPPADDGAPEGGVA